MSRVVVPLADGFDEAEAMAIADVLRGATFDVEGNRVRINLNEDERLRHPSGIFVRMGN